MSLKEQEQKYTNLWLVQVSTVWDASTTIAQRCWLKGESVFFSQERKSFYGRTVNDLAFSAWDVIQAAVSKSHCFQT